MVYRAKGLRTLGIAQMIIGVLMGILAIASLAAIHFWTSNAACGLWVGVWVFLTGLFGYMGARSDTNPVKALIGVMMGFAITACVFTGVMIIIQSFGVSQLSEVAHCRERRSSYNDYNYRYSSYCSYYSYGTVNMSLSQLKGGIALYALLLTLALIEFFVALASSIYACNACCCSGPTNVAGGTHQVAYVGTQHGNVVVIPAGTSVQTVTYNTSGQPIQTFQPAPPAYQTQQWQQPMPPQPQAPQAAFQAQGNPAMEKPPPYNYSYAQ